MRPQRVSTNDKIPTLTVMGIAMIQKCVTVKVWLLMPFTFMPKKPVTNESGRKMMVTNVKIIRVLLLSSW